MIPPPSSEPLVRYRFGRCALDPVRRELLVEGRIQSLQPRSFDLLLDLVSHAGQVRTKDQLIAAVWPTSHVTDSVLTTAIGRIRKALSESEGASAMLRSLHGVGYRFDGDVFIEDVPSGASAVSARAAVSAHAEPSASPSSPAGLTNAADVPGSDQLAHPTSFWEAQWERGVWMMASGAVGEALDLLQACLPHLDRSVSRLRPVAELLWRRARFAEAERLLVEALDAATTPRERAPLLMVRANLLLEGFKISESGELLDDVLAWVAAGEADESLFAPALVLRASVHHLAGYWHGMEPLLRQVEVSARLPHDAASLVKTEILQALYLVNRGSHRDASNRLVRALQHCREYRLTREEVDVLSRLSWLHEVSGDLSSCVMLARWATWLTSVHGDLIVWGRSRLFLLHALIQNGDIEEAVELQRQLRQTLTATDWTIGLRNMDLVSGVLAWRLGQGEDALAPMERRCRAHGFNGSAQMGSWFRLAMMRLSLGNAGVARELLEEHASTLVPSGHAMLAAGVAMSQGDRDGARQRLMRGWSVSASSRRSFREVLTSLAWMLLEDGDCVTARKVLSDLQSVVVDLPSVNFLKKVLAWREGSQSVDLPCLRELAARNCGLRNRHAWLIDAEGIHALLEGRRTLTELFWNACL